MAKLESILVPFDCAHFGKLSASQGKIGKICSAVAEVIGEIAVSLSLIGIPLLFKKAESRVYYNLPITSAAAELMTDYRLHPPRRNTRDLNSYKKTMY